MIFYLIVSKGEFKNMVEFVFYFIFSYINNGYDYVFWKWEGWL